MLKTTIKYDKNLATEQDASILIAILVKILRKIGRLDQETETLKDKNVYEITCTKNQRQKLLLIL